MFSKIFCKKKVVTIDIDKANELFAYGKHVMELPSEELLACACFIIAMVLKMSIPQYQWKAQMDVIRDYIENELIPVINVSKAIPFRSED